MKLHKTILEDIGAVVGLTAALRLAAWYGDAPTRLYVPLVAEEGQVLVKLIGMPAARALVAEWPGESLAIPRLRDYEDDVRKHNVGRMLEQGFSTRETAVALRIGERRVQQICQELELAGLIAPIGSAKKKKGV